MTSYPVYTMGKGKGSSSGKKQRSMDRADNWHQYVKWIGRRIQKSYSRTVKPTPRPRPHPTPWAESGRKSTKFEKTSKVWHKVWHKAWQHRHMTSNTLEWTTRNIEDLDIFSEVTQICSGVTPMCSGLTPVISEIIPRTPGSQHDSTLSTVWCFVPQVLCHICHNFSLIFGT